MNDRTAPATALEVCAQLGGEPHKAVDTANNDTNPIIGDKP